MNEVWSKVKAKGREVLILLMAVAMLLSMAMGIVGDAILILLVGAVGWFLSEPPKDDGKPDDKK